MKNDELNKFYANIIKQSRLKSGLKQCQVAAKAKINQELISRMERGISEISLPRFVRVMTAIDPKFIKDIVPSWWFNQNKNEVTK